MHKNFIVFCRLCGSLCSSRKWAPEIRLKSVKKVWLFISFLSHFDPYYLVMFVCQVASVMSHSVQPYVWTVACQAPLSIEFSRWEYWSGLPCCLPGDLLDPGIKPAFLKSNLHWQVASLPLAPPGKPLGTFNVEYKNFLLFYLKRTCIWLVLLMVSRRLNTQSEWRGGCLPCVSG